MPWPPSFAATPLSAAGARAVGASRARRPAGCPRGTTGAGDRESGCRAGRGRSSASRRERSRLVWAPAATATCLARRCPPSWSPRRTGPAGSRMQTGELNVRATTRCHKNSIRFRSATSCSSSTRNFFGQVKQQVNQGTNLFELRKFAG